MPAAEDSLEVTTLLRSSMAARGGCIETLRKKQMDGFFWVRFQAHLPVLHCILHFSIQYIDLCVSLEVRFFFYSCISDISPKTGYYDYNQENYYKTKSAVV
jgi:hypothetical protein